MNENQEEIKRLEDEISYLKSENQGLKDKLTSFKSLDEEMIGKRVFEAAYKRLTTYITIGGITTILIGFVGYKSVTTFIENQADTVAKRMDTRAITNLAKQRLDMQISVISKKTLTVMTDRLTDSANYLFRIISNKLNAVNQQNLISHTGEKNLHTTPLRYDVPTKIDLSNILGPINDQGSESSAVAFVLADALSQSLRLQTGRNIEFSARYIYNNINNHADNGATFIDGLNFLLMNGAITQNLWKYVPGQFNLPIPADLKSTPHYKIGYYNRVDISIQKFKSILASNKIIMVGITDYEQFRVLNKDNILPAYKSNFVLLGEIARNIVGYNDSTRLFKLRYSWGVNQGNHGYYYLRYSDFNKIITEAYILGDVIVPRS